MSRILAFTSLAFCVGSAGSAGASLPVHASRARRPVIVVTDPGIDDSIALLTLAAAPELELRAVLANFGSLHDVTELGLNAAGVLALAGQDHVPVYLGAAEPLAAAFRDLGGALFHGRDGLGGVPRPPAQRAPEAPEASNAAEFLVSACRTWEPKPALVCLSPLTTVALALALEPRLPRLCPDLFVMGGTVTAPGNTSPLAEANFENDPEAAGRVLAAGFDLRIAGLDVTMATWLDDAYLETLRDLPNTAGPFVYNITRFYTQAYRQRAGFDGGMPLHDPSAVMMLLRPSLYEMFRWSAIIDTSDYPSPTRGLVVADRRGGPLSPPPAPNVTTSFAMRVDAQGVRNELRRLLAMLP